MARVVSVQCFYCGATNNTTQSYACLKCGWILPKNAPKKTTRRPAFFNWSPDSRFLAALNMQTYGCGWHQCDYGYSRDGVGSQNFMVALQIFQAPTLISKKE